MIAFLRKLFRDLRQGLSGYQSGTGPGTARSRAEARAWLDKWDADRSAERFRVSEEQAQVASGARTADERAREAERDRLAEEHAQAAQHKQEEKDRPVEAAILDVMARRAEIVDRFLDVATRHVARKDE